ncbi:hypothetical protein BBY67_001818 [Salmonella enterica subsp. enterica serovar Typhi]|nr:hypothetical protein [Salmonella enterica]EDS8685952.1 hypothetical protein [Salmonella enterica subsp. enterica serovar Typhi]EDY0065101.1 hypothetical protein [Salmonella enterica]EEJ0956755.1 hypothetical protein [Salmonella enterica]
MAADVSLVIKHYAAKGRVEPNHNKRCSTQSVAGNLWPLTFRSSLNIMPRKEELNQIIKSIQLTLFL